MGFEVRRQETASKTVRMPVELIRELEGLARRSGISFNQLVIQCCVFALAQLDEQNNEEH